MKTVPHVQGLRGLLTLSLSSFLAACSTFHPVEATPDGILESVAPGDTVRITTWDGTELKMVVLSATRAQVSGRIPAHDWESVRVPIEQIDTVAVERPNVKKAMLTTLVPAVIAAIIICNSQDCETDAAVIATFEP
jgi:hypothetical protein